MKKLFFILFALLLFVFTEPVVAKIGVGVGTGKIVVDQDLKPGQSYNLPPFNVLNTGDEDSDYTVDISYHENQEELRPSSDWFSFSPTKFHLKPGEVQVVEISLDLPIKAQPGKYFVFLTAQPEATSESEGTTISVAAASKLYFTITPANLVLGAYYKAISLWVKYSPWPQIAVAFTFFVIVFSLIKKHLNIQVSLNKKVSEDTDSEE